MDRRRHAVIDFLGRTSYSLFLIHFAVLVLVATVWVRNDWGVRFDAAGGMAVAYVLSLIVAVVFYRAVELPAARLSKRFA